MFSASTESINVQNLRFGSVFVSPIEIDWAEPDDDIDDPRRSVFEAETVTVEDTDIDVTVILRNGYAAYAMLGGRPVERFEWDADADWAASIDEDQFDALFETETESTGPAMNYWYPCAAINRDSDAVEAAAALAGLPLCVVEVDGAYGFALTGGGTDLTWEIVEAYMRCGQLPPVHYARDLPGMADRGGSSEVDRKIIDACTRSLAGAVENLQYSLRLHNERWNSAS